MNLGGSTKGFEYECFNLGSTQVCLRYMSTVYSMDNSLIEPNEATKKLIVMLVGSPLKLGRKRLSYRCSSRRSFRKSVGVEPRVTLGELPSPVTAVIELEQMTLRKSKRAASGITPRRQATPCSAPPGRLDFVVVVVVIDVVVVVVIVFVDVADDGRSHAHCRRKCHVDPPAIRPKLFFLREDNALGLL
jgi:hypothetical protein